MEHFRLAAWKSHEQGLVIKKISLKKAEWIKIVSSLLITRFCCLFVSGLFYYSTLLKITDRKIENNKALPQSNFLASKKRLDKKRGPWQKTRVKEKTDAFRLRFCGFLLAFQSKFMLEIKIIPPLFTNSRVNPASLFSMLY